MQRLTLRRTLAAFAAVALVFAAVVGVFVILLGGAISAQAPDPFVSDGDPCCGHPDTWGEVASGVAWTLGYVVLDGVLIAVAVALFIWSASGAWPRWRRLLLIPLGGFLASTSVFAAVLVPQLDKGRELPGCDDFAFREADWRSRDDDRRLASAWGIAECGMFKDANRRTVENELGKPSTEGSTGDRYYLRYDGLDLIFDSDRLVEADAGYSGG